MLSLSTDCLLTYHTKYSTYNYVHVVHINLFSPYKALIPWMSSVFKTFTTPEGIPLNITAF
ncbi:hypothetical protein Hanom_Chr09g00823941 [Helianthus anomalus]